MMENMKKARENADIVIVSCHWGIEYDYHPNTFQKNMAKQLADAGADADYCLRLFRRGLACAYTPFAVLLLHGNLPCIADAPTPTRMRCYDTLRPVLASGDPFFSPHFDYSSVVPIVCANPRPPLRCHTYTIG